MITKTESREIFDRSKIGVGDIIEFSEYYGLRNKPRYRHWAIVSRVEDTTVWIHQRDYCEDKLESGIGIPIGRADDIRIIFRHPLNVKKGR